MIETMLLLIPVVILSLTIHEYAHARMALAWGDSTALTRGRCSLNPLVHLDPLGLLVLIGTQMFGWAKPVPFAPTHLRSRKMGTIMVALAGPASNLALAFALGLGCKFLHGHVPATIYAMLRVGMVINVVLCVFNLVPLFPLDGHHIMRELLPPRDQGGFMAWQRRYGQWILLAILILPPLLRVQGPLGILFGAALRGMTLLFGLV